jgi:hypothetical protein
MLLSNSANFVLMDMTVEDDFHMHVDLAFPDRSGSNRTKFVDARFTNGIWEWTVDLLRLDQMSGKNASRVSSSTSFIEL